MGVEYPGIGPLQLVMLGFETTERFRGDIARELLDLRGRGMIRLLDARSFHRSREGKLIEVDLGSLIPSGAEESANAVAGLLGANGAGGNGGLRNPEVLASTAGLSVEDLRLLTEQIRTGDHALAILVEHLWAARLREAVREAGGRLVGQGFLTPELAMVVGAEIQARADAEAALELANAARGSALVEALSILSRRQPGTARDRTQSATEVVRVLVADGFVHEAEAPAAIDALVTAGLIEAAAMEAAIAESEEMLKRHRDEPPSADPD